MNNYFSFIKYELANSGKTLETGDFVAITLKNGKTVEGRLLEKNEDYISLEMFIGDEPMNENTDVIEFAEGNAGFVIDYSVFPTEQITSLTKYKKLQRKTNKDG